MNKTVMGLAAASVLATGTAFVATPAPAQSSGGQIGYIVVYGDDPCPRATESEPGRLQCPAVGAREHRADPQPKPARMVADRLCLNASPRGRGPDRDVLAGDVDHPCRTGVVDVRKHQNGRSRT